MAEVPGQAKIPPTVPLEEADKDRQEMYSAAAKAFKEGQDRVETGSSDSFVPGSTPSPEAADPNKPPEPEVLPEDKHAFVRALLADRQFEKTYTLYGTVEAVFVDRTTEENTKLFERLDKIEKDDEWSLAADQFCLVTTLRELKRGKDGRNAYTPTDEWEKRLAELQGLSKPLYDSLVDASRNFEALVKHMVSKAADPDFWPGGKNASPLRRTAAAS